MIIDTSALIAILRQEEEGARFTDVLLQSADNRISAGTLLEAQLIAAGYNGLDELVALLEEIDVEIVPFDARQAELAFEAFQRFGKGRHPAGLNFGDCFAYALARTLDEPLLFKGNDFSQTDIEPAVRLTPP